MIICGLKLTHDGAVALVEDGNLVFSAEMEKLNNNSRYAGIEDAEEIGQVLSRFGYEPGQVDAFVVDGWGGNDEDELAIQPRLKIGPDHNYLSIRNGGAAYQLPVAQYQEKKLSDNVLAPGHFEGLRIGGQSFRYTSFLHVAGHIASAYCTSPFPQLAQDAYVLVWDGGMFPNLYYFHCQTGKVDNLGPLFFLVGNVYTIFAQHFGPFKVGGNFAKDNLSVAGKVMAYIALGEVKEELFAHFNDIYKQNTPHFMGFANFLANEFKRRTARSPYRDEDVLTTFHAFLEKLLVEKLKKKVERFPRPHRNLCLAGGCALNIKWNSAIRESHFFDRVYVPPFPNDSGSAIGMACAGMLLQQPGKPLNWNVYSGPPVAGSEPAPGWTPRACSPAELAGLLFRTGEPVVFLNGRAELGPRALGNRSILAAATSPAMKEVLNRVKARESYRPVSPICLVDRAGDLFEPGSADPYMLFDHRVRPGWAEKIPAVCHLDGTARLQTVSAAENPVVAEVLTAYEQLSGIPLLCNTSANYNGKGFFPDVRSATGWNQVNYVWHSGILYEKTPKIQF